MILFSHYHHSLIEPSQFFHHRQYLMNLNPIHWKIFPRKLALSMMQLVKDNFLNGDAAISLLGKEGR